MASIQGLFQPVVRPMTREKRQRTLGFDNADGFANPEPRSNPATRPPSDPESKSNDASDSRPSASELATIEKGPIKPVSPDSVAPDSGQPQAKQSESEQSESEQSGNGAGTEGSARDGKGQDGMAQDEMAQDVGTIAGKTVYVIDAHALIYQVFHALMGAEMTSPTGQPVGAVHGFVRDVLDLIEKQQPDYLICAFDHPGDNFRHQIFDQYKANREEMPSDLRLQIQTIQDMVAALKVPILSLPDYEADDLLATVAHQVAKEAGHCVLVTNDKDCRQLINANVRLLNIRKNQFYDEVALQEDWGIRPDQVVDFQSLVGDSVDNVPGVPLIGPKLARDLLAQFDTLDAVLNNVDSVSGKKRKENLTNFRDQALMSRDLVRLANDAPIELDWEQARPGDYDIDAALKICADLGFRSLSDRIRQLGSSEPAPEWEAVYQTIDTEDSLRKLADDLQTQRRIVVDTETTSTQPRQAEIVGYALASEPGKAYYVPVRAPEADARIDPDVAREILAPILEDESIEKIGQNLKYDIVVMRGAGLELKGPLFDTMVADYLLDPGQRNHNMDELAHRYLRHETIKISELIGKGKNQKRMDEVAVERVTPYAAEDADVPCRLAPILEQSMAEEKLLELFNDVEMPLIRVLAEMEFNGIAVDQAYLVELGKEFGARIDELEAKVYELADKTFNIDSPQQLATVLFDDLELPVVKKTKTGRSTDAEVLNQLASLHPLPATIIEYRQFAKLKNTYVDALLELIHPETGRIHTSFMQDVAATGRLSSKDPNLQNIPVRTEAGRKIRTAFIAGQQDWKLLAADYSQIELRVLAHFSGDAALQEAFENDEDIHTRVAAEVGGVDLSEVSSEMRRRAKAINFGIIYGQSPFGLAKALGIPQDEAAAFIDSYFERYPGVNEFMEQVLHTAHTTREVSTILGRKRAVQGVRDAITRGDKRQRNLPERIAVNTVIQGSAADLIKLAMLRLYEKLPEEMETAKLLLQIHDELVFEAHQSELPKLAALVRQEMSNVYDLAVPLKVDVKAGDNWGNCEAIPDA